MASEFVVRKVAVAGGLMALHGEVKTGTVRDIDTGTTSGNKRFMITKIEGADGPLTQALQMQKVTLVVKNLSVGDVIVGETLYIE